VDRRQALYVFACLAGWASQATAQRSARRIAVLHPGRESGFRSLIDTFKVALRDLGHVEGRDILMDVNWADDRPERLPILASGIVGRKPAVIVTSASAGIRALKKATSSIPIVFATGGNPVEQGFVESLQHPGGNITGILVYPLLTQKLIEIVREALPDVKRLAFFSSSGDPASKNELQGADETARRLKFEPFLVSVSGRDDFARAFEEVGKRKADALVVPQVSLFSSNTSDLAMRALRAKLPLFSTYINIAEEGGLVSYGTPREDNYRRAAALVDKILRGANPAELPVEQPTRFQLVVNQGTAAAIGANVSPVTIFRADRLIH
jgi:putative ABC transport system substrate-binding protein